MIEQPRPSGSPALPQREASDAIGAPTEPATPPQPAADSATQRDVTLVIPGRNCANTIRACLDSVIPLIASNELSQIIFVDDGSTDHTVTIVTEIMASSSRPSACRTLPSTGSSRGAAAARNRGIKAATTELVWCLDADCIAENGSLSRLVAGFDSQAVVAVGGGLGNAVTGSLLADMIQQEIAYRHGRMPTRVNFLASGNVVYRRAALDAVGGFDEQFQWAHDAELAFRLRSAGYELRFRGDAIARHHHFTNWIDYLAKQSAYARNRILLYRRYPAMASGDDYSSWVDHLQPPTSLVAVASLPLMLTASYWPITAALWAFLFLLALPLSVRIIHRGGPSMLFFPAFTIVRSLARGVGALKGLAATIFTRTPPIGRTSTEPQQATMNSPSGEHA